jgi:hypothetical protein
VQEDGRQDARAGIGVGPHDQDAQRHGTETVPGDPAEVVSTLEIRHEMKERPHQTQADRGRQRAPPRSQRLEGVSRPARFLSDGGDKEHDEEDRGRQERKLQLGEWSPEQALEAVRQQVDRRHHQDDRHVPHRLDAPIAEDPPQQAPEASDSVLAVDQDQGCEERTDQLERTQREPDRSAFRRLDQGPEQPEGNSEGEHQHEEPQR